MQKILIIDDSLMDRKLLMSALRKFGIENEVLQAKDGEEGIQVLSENYEDIAVILLDWQMPKMSGIEFMKATRGISEVSNIPIVMVTASGSDANKQEARNANPDLAGYVIKPYDPNILAECVKQYV